jgi:hypothetical protein
MHLILAALWFIVALAFFFGLRLDLGARVLVVHPSPLLGCVILLLCLLKVVRWWGARAAARRRAMREELWQQSPPEERRPRPERAPDPTFDFTDRPPS